jgi:hypothetical protein
LLCSLWLEDSTFLTRPARESPVNGLPATSSIPAQMMVKARWQQARWQNHGGESRSVALANVGNGNLSLSSMTITGDFIEQSNCRKKLTIEKSCAIEVQFQPQSKGSLTGEITIKDNALATPQKISLMGIGK